MPVRTAKFALFAGAIMLVACAPTDDSNVRIEQVDTCGAQEFDDLIGKKFSDFEALIDQQSSVPPYRPVGPHLVSTADFNPKRINVAIRPNGVIEQFFCG